MLAEATMFWDPEKSYFDDFFYLEWTSASFFISHPSRPILGDVFLSLSFQILLHQSEIITSFSEQQYYII